MTGRTATSARAGRGSGDPHRALSRPVLTGAALGIAASFVGVKTASSDPFDVAVDRVRVPLGRRADMAVAASTDLGSVYGMLGMATVLAAAGRRRAALDVVGAGSTAWIVAQAAKPLVDRQRPYESHGADQLVATPAGSSWPSGHSAVAAATGATLAAHAGRPGGRRLGIAIAAYVAISRIYVGVHHATDVVAGAGFGVLSAAGWRAVRRGAARWRRRAALSSRRVRQSGVMVGGD